MTTVAEHADTIRRRLFAGSIGQYNFLAGDIDATDTTITLAESITGVVPGVKLAVGSELFMVRPTPDPGAKTVPVSRGFFGTAKAAHTAGDLVEVAPRFPLADITDAMREEIQSWGEPLFQVAGPLAFNSASDLRAYDLTGAYNPYFLLEVVQENSTLTAAENSRSYVDAELIRDMDRTDFPSGFAVQFRRRPAVGVPIRVTWAEPLDVDDWRDSTDLEDDVGLRSSWLDIVTFGVMWRLLTAKEVGRTDLHASGETRKGQEIPPGYLSSAADRYAKYRDRRIADEALELRGAYPFRFR